MKFETENPGLVKLLGVLVAGVAIVVGAAVVPAAMPFMSMLAGAALGAVGVTINGKPQ